MTELFIKSDPVTIIGQDFVTENYGDITAQTVKFNNTLLRNEDNHPRGMSCKMEIEQSSTSGVFFELTARVNLYFDWDLVDRSLFRKVLQHAQSVAIDEFFDRSHVDKRRFSLPVLEVRPEVSDALYAQMKS